MFNRLLALATLLVFSSAAHASIEAAERAVATTIATPIHQLRIYELNPAKSSIFHARFRDHATRIMKRHGFKVLAMWETASVKGPEFAYLLEWQDEGQMRSAWAAFLTDREWSDIKAATRARDGSIMGGIEDRIMRTMSYSPVLKPAN